MSAQAREDVRGVSAPCTHLQRAPVTADPDSMASCSAVSLPKKKKPKPVQSFCSSYSEAAQASGAAAAACPDPASPTNASLNPLFGLGLQYGVFNADTRTIHRVVLPILRMQSVAGAFSTDSPCNMQKPCCSLKALLVARALRAGSLSPRCLPGEAAPSNSHPLHRKTLHRDRRRNKCRFGPVLPALACFVAHRTTCSFLPTRDCYGLLRPSCSHVTAQLHDGLHALAGSDGFSLHSCPACVPEQLYKWVRRLTRRRCKF